MYGARVASELWSESRCKQCPPYMGAELEYYVAQSMEKCCVCSNFCAVGHKEGLCARGESHAGCRMSYCVLTWRIVNCGVVPCSARHKLKHEVVRGDDVLMYISCRLTSWAPKHGFSHCNVGKLWCASICCVKQTMRKCLKISVKTLLIQIFFVYLPAFMRVMPSRTRSALRAKCLKTNNLECNKAEINNF